MAKKIPFIVGSFNYDGLTHAQRVCRLYRATLQNIWSYEYRDMEKQRRDMLRVRYLIDKNTEVKDPKMQKQIYEKWVGIFEKYKHQEPIIHPECPDGTAFDRQIYIPSHVACATPEASWWVKEWQLERKISGLKKWEWDIRPAWRSLITRNNRRSHLLGYEDDI